MLYLRASSTWTSPLRAYMHKSTHHYLYVFKNFHLQCDALKTAGSEEGMLQATCEDQRSPASRCRSSMKIFADKRDGFANISKESKYIASIASMTCLLIS